MIPKLYNKNETNFVHNGLGLLTGSIDVVATEELNGMFELRIEYDSEGFLADVIQEEMIIKAKANDKQEEQLFRIYSITKNHENDNLIIDAQHITYDLGNNFVEKLEARNLTKRQVMQLIGSSTNYEHPFNVTSSNTTTQSSTSLYRTNPLQMIAGIEGSILQIWGGQIERDNFNLIMHDRRGSDDGVLVTYKKNLTGLTAKFDISNLVTRIFPFVFKEATDDEPERLITVSGKYVDSPNINDYKMPYILPIDYSSDDRINADGTDAQIRTQLTNLANAYFNETGNDKPTVEMEVQFEHLWETEEYKDVAALELVGMGDTITVEHSKLGVEGTAVVNRIEYDVIARKNRAVDVGNVRASFTDRVNEVSNIVDRVDEIDKNANQAIRSANGKNTIYYGPDEPTDGNKDDIWFRVVDGEYTRTYRFDGIQWQLIMSKDIADIEETASSARNRANEAVEKAELATSNANEAISEAQTAFDEAQDALGVAGNAENIATTVGELATALDTTVSGHTTQITDIEGELSRKMTTIDADNKYATQSALQQTSQSLSSDIVAVQGNLDALEIGGRNLLKNSEGPFELKPRNEGVSGDNFQYKRFYCDMEVGKEYTISAKIEVTYGDYNEVTIYVYPSGTRENVPIEEDGTVKSTFIKTNENSDSVLIYAGISGDTRNQGAIISNVQIEKGNKATDWSPAPEDIDYQFSSIIQTVDSITTRVGDSEGNISSLQQTSESFATRIGDAEGNVSTLTQTAQGLQNRVSDAEGNISTVTQLADTLQSDLRDAEGNINTLTETASSMQRTISSVRDDLDGIEIGGRNLAKESSIILQNTTYHEDYYMYELSTERASIRIKSEVFEPNTSYILSFKLIKTTGDIMYMGGHATLFTSGETKVYMDGEYISNSWSSSMANPYPNDTKDHDFVIYFKTNSMTGTNNDLYIQPNRLIYDWTYTAFIWDLQVEKGNKATDWSPAPEDMATTGQLHDVREFTTSSFSQLSYNINLRVEKGDVINQINISDEDILISGKKLILDSDTTVTGTFRVNNANITSVDAGKMTTGTLDAAQVSVINLSANSITGGILQSQNSNTTFNLNTGELNLVNNDITFGNSANINFTSRGNRITYRYASGITRSAGLGVGVALGDEYPFAYLGTTGASELDTLSQYFSGFITNTTARIAEGGSNSVSGYRFMVRNKAVDYDKGVVFDFNGSRPSITMLNGGSHNYEIGTLRRIYGRQYIDFRNYEDNTKGWRMETAYAGDGSDISFRGLNDYNYILGENTSARRIRNIFLRNNPVVGSDRRLKEDITEISHGLDLIKQLNPVLYRLKPTRAETRNELQFGLIAQEVEPVLTSLGYDTSDMSLIKRDDENMLSMTYTELTPFLIKSDQDLNEKIDLTREELILKIASLEDRLNKLEVA